MRIGHWYKLQGQMGEKFIGQYMGKQRGSECCICGKGCNASCFNIWYRSGKHEDYETWGFGSEHMPEILEDMGTSERPIINK